MYRSSEPRKRSQKDMSTISLFFLIHVDLNMISRLQLCVYHIILATLFVPVRANMNLALHGTVAQETTYTDGAGSLYGANLAIKGPANNNWDEGCSSTAANQSTQWWGLFLPKLAYITNIKFYLPKDVPQQMNGFRLYFGNGSVYSNSTELCYIDLDRQAYRNLNQSIDCDLSPTKNVYFFNRHAFVQLCYTEIYGCWKGTWGPNCTTDCPVECIGNYCFPQNGSCIWGCDLQKCFQGECDAKTNVCSEGCVPGRGGRYCTLYNTMYNRTTKQSLTGSRSSANVLTDGNTTSCVSMVTTSSNSFIQIGNDSLIVTTGVYLFFGDTNPPVGIHKVYCSNTTDSWADGIVLYNAEYYNKDTIVFAICKYIIYIPPIQIGNSNIDICEIEIGGCSYGKYGDSCQLTCPKNCMGTCDLITGKCSVGCSAGWLGEICDIVLTESSAINKFGFFVGGVASLCAVLFIIWMVKNARRRILKTKEISQDIDNSHSNSDNQHYEDVMNLEGVSTYQDLAKQTVTESNDYDQINKAYGLQ